MKNARSDWKKFEELALSIQQHLAPDAKVTGNAHLPGKSGVERQIDILIEQSAGQYDLRIVVDCKDHKHPVDVKDVESFLGLVEDVGAHKGALMAANGVSAAAKKRASNAGLDLFRLIDTADHKWRTYVSIPAIFSDFSIRQSSFTISWTGRGALRGDIRYMPVFRRDGSLIDCVSNLVIDRWEDGTIPVKGGEYNAIPVAREPIFLRDGERLFEISLKVNVQVHEAVYFGQLPLVQAQGLKSELDDSAHIANGFTTAFWNPEKIAREWRPIVSSEQLSVEPVMRLSVKSVYPRFPTPNDG